MKKDNGLTISTIKDCYNIGNYFDGKILGVGVTGFMRIIPALFLKDHFGIICYKNSLDVNILREYTKVFCLEEYSNIQLKKLNTINILETQETKDYIKKIKGTYIIVYKNNKETEDTIKKLHLNIIAPKSEIRDIFEDKKEIRKILPKIGIPPIPGENIYIDMFLKKEYTYFQKQYGKHLVIQLPDIKTGGGLGTIFIRNQKDFMEFKDTIKDKSYRKTTIKSINITKFITGISCSITGCATKYGTFSTSVQTQLIDIPEVINLKKGKGLFCGHDRSLYHFSKKVQKKASEITEKLGTYMYQKGYKGIFGVDLIIEGDNVYFVECNSRYTGAFPMISFLDIKEEIPPMDVFHLLELIGLEYQVNFEKMNKLYKYRKEGSHIILSNKLNNEITCKKDLIPGVYTYTNNRITYKRPGIGYNDITHKNEFLIIDGTPKKGEKIRAYDKLSRFCHLLFPGKIAVNPNKLNNRTKKIIDHIYTSYFIEK